MLAQGETQWNPGKHTIRRHEPRRGDTQEPFTRKRTGSVEVMKSGVTIYEPVCAQQPRPHWLDMLGYSLSPLPGLVPRQSEGLTRTLITSDRRFIAVGF